MVIGYEPLHFNPYSLYSEAFILQGCTTNKIPDLQ